MVVHHILKNMAIVEKKQVNVYEFADNFTLLLTNSRFCADTS